MTTLRKLPTIAPRANAKNASRPNIQRDCREISNFKFQMKNRDFSFSIFHSKFFIPRSLLLSALHKVGGEWGLVASAVFKTVVSARKRRKVGSIPTRLRHAVGHDCVVPDSGVRHGAAGPYCFGTSVKNPIFIAPPWCAASIAITARSNGI